MRFTCSLELLAQLRPLGTIVGSGPGIPDAETSTNRDTDKDEAPRGAVPPAPNPRPLSPAIPLVKKLSGELEAMVVPDESHHLFHGRRTVIRYSMLG